SLIIAATSSCAHVGRPTLRVRVGLGAPTIGGSGLWRAGADRFGQLAGVEDTGDAQSTPEGPPALRQREASRIGMDARSPTRLSARRIGHDAKPPGALI